MSKLIVCIVYSGRSASYKTPDQLTTPIPVIMAQNYMVNSGMSSWASLEIIASNRYKLDHTLAQGESQHDDD